MFTTKQRDKSAIFNNGTINCRNGEIKIRF